MNFLDLAILGAFALGFYGGYKKGFLQTFKGLLIYIGSFLGALSFYKPFSDFLSSSFFMERQLITAARRIIDLPDELRDMPATVIQGDTIEKGLATMDLPQGFHVQVIEMTDSLVAISTRSEVASVSDAVYYFLGTLLTQVMSFTLLIFIFGFTIKAILYFATKNRDSIQIGMVDNWIGGFLGIGKQLVTVGIMLLILYPILSIGIVEGNNKGVISQLATAVQGSAVCTTILEVLDKNI